MNVYIPVYDAGRRQVWTEKSEDLRNITNRSIAKYKPGAGFYGPIYCNNMFMTEAAAWQYWTGARAEGWTLAEIRELENMTEREEKTA